MPYHKKFDAPRVVMYDEQDSDEALEADVDTLDEARDIALARTATYQQSSWNYHSRRLRPRSFAVGDLVLRLKQKIVQKLASPWEGPFVVTEVIGNGAYRLKHAETGEQSHNQWNAAHLRRFYA